MDAEGNAYIAGGTNSLDYPTVGPAQANNRGGARDVFVSKISSDGANLVYSTYLGGTAEDVARGIAVDDEGHAYVVGYSTSSNFTTRNPIQRTYASNRDAILFKLTPDGSGLVYSTFLGGNSLDDAYGVALDSQKQAHLIGVTQSQTFPVVNALQPTVASPCPRIPCTADLFVAKINAEGSALIYSTYLGGLAAEAARAIAVDAEGSAWITGNAASANFPVVQALQPQQNGGGAAVAFVAKIRD